MSEETKRKTKREDRVEEILVIIIWVLIILMTISPLIELAYYRLTGKPMPTQQPENQTNETVHPMPIPIPLPVPIPYPIPVRGR